MNWKLSNRVVVDSTGANVTGLVPSRMTDATLALVLAAPAMLSALEGMNHVTEGGFCICPCLDGLKHRNFHSTACNDAWDAIKAARTVTDITYPATDERFARVVDSAITAQAIVARALEPDLATDAEIRAAVRGPANA
jgi:hypothetical protein